MSISDKIIVIHLTDDDQMKASKALRFASKALDFASEVVLLLSAQGVNVVKRSSGGFQLLGADMNSLDAIREFLKDGGRIYVGKDCMKIQNIGSTDVIAGCEPSEPKVTFELLLSDQTAVISW